MTICITALCISSARESRLKASSIKITFMMDHSQCIKLYKRWAALRVPNSLKTALGNLSMQGLDLSSLLNKRAITLRVVTNYHRHRGTVIRQAAISSKLISTLKRKVRRVTLTLKEILIKISSKGNSTHLASCNQIIRSLISSYHLDYLKTRPQILRLHQLQYLKIASGKVSCLEPKRLCLRYLIYICRRFYQILLRLSYLLGGSK